MTTGIGNEMDPGDPPEIHAERKREKKRIRHKCNNLAAVLPMYEAFKKLEDILDEAIVLLREGTTATDMNRWMWLDVARRFVETHEKRIRKSALVAVGKQP